MLIHIRSAEVDARRPVLADGSADAAPRNVGEHSGLRRNRMVSRSLPKCRSVYRLAADFELSMAVAARRQPSGCGWCRIGTAPLPVMARLSPASVSFRARRVL